MRLDHITIQAKNLLRCTTIKKRLGLYCLSFALVELISAAATLEILEERKVSGASLPPKSNLYSFINRLKFGSYKR